MKRREISGLHAYVAGVCLLGWALLAGLVWHGDLPHAMTQHALFITLTVLLFLGEVRPIPVLRGGGGSTEIATSTPFIFGLLLTVGLPAAAAALAIASLAADLLQRKPWIRALFNVAQYTVALSASAVVLQLWGGTELFQDPAAAGQDLVLLLLAGLVFFSLNSSLPCIAVALEHRQLPLSVLTRDFNYQVATAGVMIAVSPLIVVAARHSLLLLPTLLLPAIAVHWSASLSLKNERQSLHDTLTGLPNRTLFHVRVTDAIATSPRAAVMLVDLDHFKEVNDTLGHRTGDKLLQEVGERLRGIVGPHSTVARLGGDEFALLLPRVSDAAAAMSAAQRVLRELTEPFVIDDFSLSVEASIGVSLSPDDGQDSGTLLRCADVAMYLAKQARAGCELYTPDRDQHSRERLALIGQIRTAIEGDELVLHYQPKLDLRTGDVLGAEALVRWEHPELGLLPPGEFIPLIERTIHMSSFTSHVLRLALEQCSQWRKAGLALRVAVNVPVTNLHDPMFPQHVADALAAAEVPPACLELELTESTIMADPLRAMTVLRALHKMGVGLAVDDFGTGYSSLSYLKQLPVDTLKIDKSFVTNMADDLEDESIVNSTLGLARSLGLTAVAEGVEDAMTLEMLRAAGCEQAQGYYIGRPMSGPAFTRWLVAYTTRPSRQAAMAVTRAVRIEPMKLVGEAG